VENVFMENYTPKVNHTVTVQRYTRRFIVTVVDTKKQSADLRTAPVSGKPNYTLGSVAWKAISYLDAGHAVKETTGNH
jgi:hypothetical protein